MSEYEYSKFGEWLERNDEIDPDVARISDQEISELLLLLEWAGVDTEDVPLYELLKKKGLSKTIDRAKSQDEPQHLQMLTGLDRGKSADVKDWNKYEILKDLFRQDPEVSEHTNAIFQCVLFSNTIPPTGRGKTSTMYFLTEIAQSVIPDLRILSNNPNDPFETVPEEWADIEGIIREHDGVMLLLLDEAAQFLQYADQTGGKSVSQMLKLLRHNDTHLMMVGHTGMDIPADIRRQVYVLNKESQKKGTLGYGIKKKSGDDRMEVAEAVLNLKNIPHTDIDYGGKGDPAIDISFEKEAEREEVERPSCRATTNSGDPCPATAEYPSDDPIACYNHQHKIDELREE